MRPLRWLLALLAICLISLSAAETQVAAGAYHALMLDSDGQVWAWGDNTYGQCGDNTTLDRPTAVKVLRSGGANLDRVIAIAAGSLHSLAVRDDGTVWAWGFNFQGQLGNGDSSNRMQAVQVGKQAGGVLDKIVSVSAGYYHSMALSGDGQVWTWGSDDYGALGDSFAYSGIVTGAVLAGTDFDSPPFFNHFHIPLSNIIAISAGAWSGYALHANGTVYSWGWGGQGGLGNGGVATMNTATTVQTSAGVNLSGIVAIAGGAYAGYALTSGGVVYSWGANDTGQLAQGSTSDAVFATFAANIGIKQISASPFRADPVGGEPYGTGGHFVALSYTAVPYTCGRDSTLQLGDDGISAQKNALTLISMSGNRVKQVAAGGTFTLFLMADGRVLAVGANGNGELGRGTSGANAHPPAVASAQWNLVGVQQVACGGNHTLALRGDGSVWSWGLNTQGQLGTGNQTPASAAVQVMESPGVPMKDIIAVSAGQQHSLALRADGRVYCWGANYNGQSGGADLTNPVLNPVVLFPFAKQISAGGDTSAALTYQGYVQTWGDNQYGTLAAGSTSPSTRFNPEYALVSTSPLVYLNRVRQIELGWAHGIALREDGTTVGWGNNGNGQLGSGAYGTTYGADANGTLANVKQVVAGSYHCAFLLASGAVQSAGYNGWGSLGDGTGSGSPATPVATVNIPDAAGNPARSLSAGTYPGNTTLALMSNGLCRAWGENGNGQVGNDSTVNALAPDKVYVGAAPAQLAMVSAISMGNSHGAAVLSDGTVYCWGLGTSGQLGDGLNTSSKTAVKSDGKWRPQVSITASVSTATEGSSSGQFTLTRTGTTTGTIAIGAIIGGTASNGTDYSTLAGPFVLSAGSVSKAISVVSIDDAVDEDDETVIATLTATATARVGASGSAQVTIIDNDTAGFLVTGGPLTTTEAPGAGHTETFTMALTSQPLANVTIGLLSSSPTEATVSPNSVLFTPINWSSPQTITVTGVDDDFADADAPYTITTNPASSLDPRYNALNPPDVSGNNVNDDVIGFQVSKASITTDESGSTDSFTVRLTSRPTATVTIPVSSSNAGEASVSVSALTFTGLNWNTPQTVTVTGINDNPPVVDGPIGYTVKLEPATAGSGDYSNQDPPDVTGTNTDDDIAGVLISESAGTTAVSEGGATDTYTVVLTTKPAGSVTITVTDDIQVSAAPASLVFTTGNWNTPQTVTVTASDDQVAEGAHSGTVSHSASSGDPNYQGLSIAQVTAQVTDNDVAGFVYGAISGDTTEAGGTADFTVRLATKPTSDVSIDFVSSDSSEGSISATLLTFTTLTWNVPQSVTTTGVDDPIDDGDQTWSANLSTITSADPLYQALSAGPAVSIVNRDDDVAGLVVAISGGSTDLTEGGTNDSITVALSSQPLGDVTVNLNGGDQVNCSPSELTFTAMNWNVAQPVTLSAVNDAEAEGTHAGTVSFSQLSADDLYADLSAPAVTVTITDNDTAGFAISVISGNTSETGTTATFSVHLASQPPVGFTVSIPLSSSNAAEGTLVSASPLIFDSTNWSTDQIVTVQGVDDNPPVVDGSVAYSVVLGAVTSSDPFYSGLNPPDVSVINDDDDTAGISIVESGGSTASSESGATDTVSVVLITQPVGTVLVTLSGGAQATVSPSVLSFTVSDWNIAQTVTIGAVDDHQIEGNHLGSVTLSAAGGGYDLVLAGPVAVSITDNDSAGFSITPTSGLVTSEAGATAQFSVVLTAQPTADVVLPLSTSDAAQGSPNVASLTFTTADWDVPQFVTINGLDDLVADALVSTPYTIISGDPTSADTHFSNLTATDVDDVSVSNLDDDIPGVTVTPLAGLTTSEAGAVAIFTVRLNTTPGANVTIAVTSSNTNEATVSPNSLSFTSTTPQLVTVTGVDDDVDDGNQTVIIQLGSCVSADSSYSGINPPDVAITNLDDDTAGGIVDTGGSLLVVEGSTTDAYTIRLSTRPTGTVTVQLTPSNQLTVDTDGGTAGDQTSLVFSTTDFSTPKTVTVRAVDDSIAEGFHTGTIAHLTTGGGFDGVSLPTVTATIADNDTPGFVISVVTGTITESGGTATFSVRLANQPGAAVSVAVSSSDLTEGTVSPSSLSFTPANWNTAQTVTVTGQDDAVADGNVAWTVVLAAAASTDPLYNGIDPADVAVVTNDNDVAGVTIAQTGGGTAVAEGGFNDTWTIVLNSKPTATVTVTVSSTSSQVIVDADSSSVGDQSTVSFTPATWNVPRTIAVRAIDDAIIEGPHSATVTTTVSGGGYAAVTIPNVAVDVTDNDSPSVVVTQTSGTTAVGEGGLTDTYSIVLAAAPSGPVTISLAPPARVTVSPAAVTFQPTSGGPNGWDFAQTITVGAVENQIAEGSTNAIITHTATGGGYAGVSIAGVSVSISDNDLPGITVSPTSGLTTTESGGSAAFTVVLTSQPTADVTVPLSSGDSTEGAVSPASLIFTAGNWSIPQQVAVTGVNDNLDDGDIAYGVLVQPATGVDTAYQGIDAPDVALVNIDNDAAGVVLSTTSLSVTEGGAGSTYTVRLASQPTGTVMVLATSDGQLTSSPTSLTFSTAAGVSGGWDVPQTITVNAADDAVAEGPHSGSVGHAASGGGYDGVSAASVSVSITDNDSAGYSISASSVVCHESFKGVVQLATSGVAGNVVSFSAGTNLSTIFVGQQAQFDGGGPNSGASSVVSAVDDGNDTVTMSGTLTSTGSAENAIFFAGFTISLTSQPTSVVLLAVSSNDASEAFASPGSLTFSPANWNMPQVVTIRGVDDLIDDDDVAFTVVLASAVSSDGFYSGLNPTDVAGLSIDDDSAGITTALTAGALQTTEAGGTSSFTVTLDSQPTAAVAIDLSINDSKQATLSLTSVQFDASDWNVAKTVVVTGADGDFIDNGAGTAFSVVFAPAVISGGSDSNYLGKVATPISGTNLAVNAAPRIDSIANQSVNEDAASFTVSMTGIGTGQSGENQVLTITSTSDNPALIPNPTVGALVGTSPGINSDLTIAPISGASGQATITVRVQDDGGTALGGVDVTTISFTVTVGEVNDPPVVDLNGPGAGTDATAAFTEGGGPVLVVDPGLTITDQDSPTLTEATATLVNLLDSGEQLTVNPAGTALTATWSVVGSSGILTIAGTSDQPMTDFQLVLRSLRYTNSSAAPTATSRTVQVIVDDGAAANSSSAVVSATITVNPINNPPTIDLNGPAPGPGYSGTYGEGDAPIPLVATTALIVDDADNAQLAGATATIISGGIDGGTFEILSANTAGTAITATWTAATLTLSLTGADTLANYQQVLRTMTYRHESEAPTIGLRQIEVLVNDGTASSPAGTISLMTVTGVDDAPVVDLNGPSVGVDQTSGSFIEGGSGVVLASPAASVSDVDTAQISQMRVTILDQAQSGEELIVVASGSLAVGMSQGFNAANGELTILGAAPAAAYTTALRGLTYFHNGEAPTGLSRSIRFIVDAGGQSSPPALATVTLSAVNDPPLVDLNGAAAGTNSAASAAEDQAPVLLCPNATLSDPDHSQLARITVTPVTRPDGPAEVLAVTVGSSGLSATFDANGVLNLAPSSGPSAARTAFEQVLRTLTYQNTLQDPASGSRTCTVQVEDPLGSTGTAQCVVTVTKVNDPAVVDLDPIAAGTGSSATFTENDTPVALAPTATITDVDNTIAVGATIAISSGPDNGSITALLEVDTTGTSITAAWDQPNLMLTLSGTDTIANYQAVLRTLTYGNSSENPPGGVRSIQVQVDDGQSLSNVPVCSLSVSAVSDLPVVDLNAGASGIDITSGTFTENGPSLLLTDPAATIVDLDDPTITDLRATITNLAQPNQEFIDVDPLTIVGAMTANFNPIIGELTVAGAATASEYQAVLRSLRYRHSGEAPSGVSRQIRVVALTGGQSSAPATATVVMAPVNDFPSVDLNGAGAGTGTGTAYTEGQAPVVLANQAVIGDPDNTDLTRVEVTPASRPDGTFEQLAVTLGSSGLDATIDAVTGKLTLSPASGTLPIAVFQDVLRTLTWVDTSDAPTTGNRTLTVSVQDPQGAIATAAISIDVGAINDPAVVDLDPIAAGTGSSATFTENDTPVALAPTATIADVDNTNAVGATIAISSGPDNGSITAVLAVDTTGTSITAAWNQSSLVLTLSGTDTIANYQAVLRTLTYGNSSENPPGGVRSIQVQVDDGQSLSIVAVCSLTVSTVSDLPVVDLNAGASGIDITSGTFTENGPSLLLTDPAATIVDLDDPTITDLRATITNLAQPNQEFIDVDPLTIVGAMTANFNPIIGELTVAGAATASEYQAVLRSLRYRHSGEAPSGVNRLIRVVALTGGQSSAPATATVVMAPVNDLPSVDLNGAGAGTGTSTAYTEGQAPVALANQAVIGDPDNTDLTRVEVTPASRPDGTFEQLAVTLGSSGLDATIDAVTGKLTLSPASGTLPIAVFQDVLRTLTWVDTSNAPTTGNRTLTVSVQDPQGAIATAAISIDVGAINDPPVVDLDPSAAGTGSAATFIENDTPVALAPTATIADVDNTNAVGATIAISSGSDNGSITAVLAVDTTGTSITAAWNQSSLVLTLSGTDTIANYQAVLRTLTYANSSENPPEGLRSILVKVNDGQGQSADVLCALSVTAVPDAPLVDLDVSNAGSGFDAGSFTEGSGPLAIAASTALVSDPDSALIVRLRATILAGQIGSEVLVIDSATLPSGVTATFNQANGEMTIDGTASALEYAVMLRSLAYQYTGQAPSSGTRSIQVVAEAAGQASSPAVATVTLIPINDPPTLNLPVATATYVEGSPAIAPLVGAVVGDPDHLELSSMTVTPIGRPDGDLEVIALSTTGTSLSLSTALDGTITVTGGPSPLAEFQQVLRSLTWVHSGRNPTEGSRTVRIQISDGALAVTADLVISVVAVNDLPTISLLDSDVEVNRGARQVITSRLPTPDGDPAHGFLAATDVETSPMALIFTVILLPSQGTLQLLPSAGAASGTQILKGGTFTQAQLVAGLVVYEHDNNLGSSDGFAISVKDAAGGESPPAVLGIHINLGQQPPVVSLGGEIQTFTENAQPVLIDAGAQVSDSDSTDFSGGLLTVHRSGGGAGDVAGDILAIRNQGTDLGQISVQGLTIAFGQGVGIDPLPIGTIASDGIGKDLVIQLNENATQARSQAMLGNLQFSHAGDNPTAGERLITVTLSDGDNGVSSPATKAVTVVPVNDAPTALPRSPVLVVPLLTVSGVVTVTDPEGALAAEPFSIAQPTTDLPTQGLVSLDRTTGQFTYTAFAAASGNDSFTITATDAGGLAVPVPVPIRITPPGGTNLAFTSLPPLHVDRDDPLIYVPVVVGADPAELTFTLVGLDGVSPPPVFNPATGAVNWQQVPMPVGGYHVFSILVSHPRTDAAVVQPVLLLVTTPAAGKG